MAVELESEVGFGDDALVMACRRPTATPPATTSSTFEAVSCPTPTICTAVGAEIPVIPNSPTPPGAQPLAEHLTGGVWRVQSLPYLTGDSGSGGFSLTGVACPTTTMCRLVGFQAFGPPANTFWGFVAIWNGSVSTQEELPTPPDTYGNFAVGPNSMSCAVGTTTCTTVGAWNPTLAYFGIVDTGGHLDDAPSSITQTLAEHTT